MTPKTKLEGWGTPWPCALCDEPGHFMDANGVMMCDEHAGSAPKPSTRPKTKWEGWCTPHYCDICGERAHAIREDGVRVCVDHDERKQQ